MAYLQTQVDALRHFERRQTEAQAAAVAALDSDRYLALHRALDELLAEPPCTRRAHRKAKAELWASVRRAYRRLEKAMTHVDALPPGPEREEASHEARKSAKRLRYATEASAPVDGKSGRGLQKRLKAVQKLLGDHQDTVVVARPVLRELGATTAGNGFT